MRTIVRTPALGAAAGSIRALISRTWQRDPVEPAAPPAPLPPLVSGDSNLASHSRKDREG